MAQPSKHAHLVIAVAVVAMLIILIALAVTEAAASHEHFAGNSDASWTGHLRTLDDALAKKNISAAERALQQAYLAALGSRRWEGMVEVGDATLQVGEASGYRKVSQVKARRVYLEAFVRARQQGSIDGLLRTAEAFSALGDRDVADAVVRMAERLAGQVRTTEARDRARVQAFRERLAAGSSRPATPQP
jgi:hypothetical protein